MRLLAGAVILFFLVGAPTFARQQDEKTQQQDKKAKPQEQQPKERTRQPQEEQRTKTKEEPNQQRTAPREQQRQPKETARQGQQRATEQQQKTRVKEQQSEQRTAQKEQQARSSQQEQQSKQQAKVRQQQQKQQYAREQRPQEPGNNGHGPATRATYHASNIHPRHGGRVIADSAYDAHFGRDHDFHAHWRHDADRFQYGGYWFTYAEPWPAVWLDSDDLYIVYDYDTDDYYLCDANHPGMELLIVVQS